jgi:hypothetical protein
MYKPVYIDILLRRLEDMVVNVCVGIVYICVCVMQPPVYSGHCVKQPPVYSGHCIRCAECKVGLTFTWLVYVRSTVDL